MVEEQGVVVAVEANAAWVETRRKAVCDSCSVNKGCGTAVISKAVGNKRSCVKVLHDRPGLRVGDEVVIGLEEQALVRGSLLVYGMPLLLMFAAAAGADYAARAWLDLQAADPLDVICAAGGFAAGLAWLRRFSRRIAADPRYQPVLLSVSTPQRPIRDTLAPTSTHLLT